MGIRALRWAGLRRDYVETYCGVMGVRGRRLRRGHFSAGSLKTQTEEITEARKMSSILLNLQAANRRKQRENG